MKQMNQGCSLEGHPCGRENHACRELAPYFPFHLVQPRTSCPQVTWNLQVADIIHMPALEGQGQGMGTRWLFLDHLEGVLRQQALPVVSCYESALAEEAMSVQKEGFTNTTWIWIKAMSGEIHWLLTQCIS